MMPRNQMMIPLFLFLLLFSMPSMAVGETVTLPLVPEKPIDTYISSLSPTGDNGSAVLMLASSDSVGHMAFSLVKFDLPSWLNTKHILGARLELNTFLVFAGSASSVEVNVHRVLEPWDESSVWSDFESLGNYPMSQDLFDENIEDSEFATAGVLMSFYLTDLVRDWISGFSSNYGVLLETPYSVVPPSESRVVSMYTSNWPYCTECYPRLIIDYTETPIPTIDFHPETLNLKSKGQWVTCYIELPDGHDVEDIDIGTIAITSIAMNGEEANVIEDIPAEAHPTEVGDYDGDGIPDLMVKFDRGSVQERIADLMVESYGQSVEDAASVVGLAKAKIKIYFETDLTGLKGVDADSTGFEGFFEGFDEVDIIDKGK